MKVAHQPILLPHSLSHCSIVPYNVRETLYIEEGSANRPFSYTSTLVLKKQGLVQEALIEFHSKPNVGRFPKVSIARFFSITIFICNIKHNDPCTVKLKGQSFCL
jgi:hypothetical protein